MIATWREVGRNGEVGREGRRSRRGHARDLIYDFMIRSPDTEEEMIFCPGCRVASAPAEEPLSKYHRASTDTRREKEINTRTEME